MTRVHIQHPSLLRLRRTLLAASVLAACTPAMAQNETTPSIVVIGSRSAPKSALDTVVPVGYIGQADIASTGTLELGKVLQELDPSVNFTSTFVSDGTDIIRPVTLRGLGPDQVLVLINGKRRHQQALVNVQQSIGRGSAGTDINAIPLSAIDHIEVLRDGAAAQYGSDAIAGVINIVPEKNSLANRRLPVRLAPPAKATATCIPAARRPGWRWAATAASCSCRWKDADATPPTAPASIRCRVDPPRVTQQLGDSLAKDAYLWLNAALPMAKEGELYAFGGVSRRTGAASGFFRPRDDGRNVTAVYPDGFLPGIQTTVKDASLALGYRHDLPGDWKFDVSVNHGRSELDFHERNSINVSYWFEPGPNFGTSPREADTGSLKFNQTTFNVDLKGPLTPQMFLAGGFEWRRDGYKIGAGDPVSYYYGRTNNPALVIRDQNGGIAAAGIQGFPGYTPATEVDDARHNVALYLDGEYRFNPELLVGAAVRHERYSDFGATTTGKLSARWDPSKTFGVRASASTGFRAPSVQQKFYSSVSTNLDSNGVLTETLTAREGSAATRAFGIAPLKEETSKNASIGLVLRPMTNLSVTARHLPDPHRRPHRFFE